MTQTTVPNEPHAYHESDAGSGAGANVDAHMPPQPGEHDAPQNPVYQGPAWNPETNEWAPSNEQHDEYGVAEPSHFDAFTANPMSDDQGDPRTFPPQNDGSTPDPRMNLLDAVRAPRGPVAAPVVEHHHVVETQEQSAGSVRSRLVAVAGNAQPSVLLEENKRRTRAVIRVFTAASTVLVQPARQGGVPQLVAAPTNPGAFFPLTTGDPNLVIESQAAVEAYGISAAGVVLVAIWEEMDSVAPGLGV